MVYVSMEGRVRADTTNNVHVRMDFRDPGASTVSRAGAGLVGRGGVSGAGWGEWGGVIHCSMSWAGPWGKVSRAGLFCPSRDPGSSMVSGVSEAGWLQPVM